MSFDDAFADRQANACAGVRVAVVQALEQLEYLLGILLREADAIVTQAEKPLAAAPGSRNMNGGIGLAAELDGVAECMAAAQSSMLRSAPPMRPE